MEAWPELREIAGDRFSAIPPDELERELVGALHGIVPNDKRFLGGETIGELFDRVLPAVDRCSKSGVGHGARRRPRRRKPGHPLARTPRRKDFLGRFEQAPGCLNVLDAGREVPPEWIVRAVNVAPDDLAHGTTRLTQMEQYWQEYVPRDGTGRDVAANAERAGSPPPSHVVLDASSESGGA